MSYDENDELYAFDTLVVGVEANTLSHITIPRDGIEPKNEDDYYQEYAQPSYYQYHVVLTFEFSNGIRHTFTGDKIACDVRDANNWVTSTSEVNEYYSDNVDYTYTFTQEDYDEIMALYE